MYIDDFYPFAGFQFAVHYLQAVSGGVRVNFPCLVELYAARCAAWCVGNFAIVGGVVARPIRVVGNGAVEPLGFHTVFEGNKRAGFGGIETEQFPLVFVLLHLHVVVGYA